MFSEIILCRAREIGLPLGEREAEKLSIYHSMLTQANQTMNLTRVPDDPAEAIDRNYLDSLSPLLFPGLMDGVKTLCDAGTGAGFPGVPLAILRPDIRVTLLDSLGKRVKFLESVIEALNLNAVAIHKRCEDAGRDSGLRGAFDCVTARALAALPVLLELSLPLVKKGGFFIAYKGPALNDELTAASNALRVLGGRARDIHKVPLRDWDHRLLVVDKFAPTPPLYPRKAGEPGRSPL